MVMDGLLLKDMFPLKNEKQDCPTWVFGREGRKEKAKWKK
jgi:hypothetical protein